jgi:AcrR family transcriptional regulator
VSVLAERTYTPVPTIHYYRRMGMLPEAREVASNRFLYDDRHVEALLVIRLLRERTDMSLEAIRTVVPELVSYGGVGAFRPDRWDEAVASYVGRSRRSHVTARLIEVARHLFAQRGFAGVNIADISREAGIAKGSFYRYFDSKEAIFLAAARSTVDAVGDELDGLPLPLTEKQAVEKLTFLLGPMAPLLLELATDELRRQPNVAGVLAAIATGLVTRLVPRLRARGKAANPIAQRVVDEAFVGLLRPTLRSTQS